MTALELNTDKLVTELKRVVHDSEELLRKTAHAVGDRAEDAREQLRDSLETARRCCHDLERKTARAMKAADRAVRRHPYETLGISLAAGLLIGFLLRRRP